MSEPRGKFYFFIIGNLSPNQNGRTGVGYMPQGEFAAVCRQCACYFRRNYAAEIMEQLANHRCEPFRAMELREVPLRPEVQISKVELSGSVMARR